MVCVRSCFAVADGVAGTAPRLTECVPPTLQDIVAHIRQRNTPPIPEDKVPVGVGGCSLSRRQAAAKAC